MPHFALGRLGPVLDLGEQLRLDPDAAMRDALAVRLRRSDPRNGTSTPIRTLKFGSSSWSSA